MRKNPEFDYLFWNNKYLIFNVLELIFCMNGEKHKQFDFTYAPVVDKNKSSLES